MPDAAPPTRARLVLLALLVLLLAHASSYGLCLQDDAFISFRYARNLVAGHGLVFNPGDPVEGYSNFLWTLLVAGAMAAGTDPLLAAVALGLLGAAGTALAGWRLGRRHAGPCRALVVPAVLALDAGFVLEAVQGLETAFYALLVTAGVGLALRESAGERRLAWSGPVLGLAALTRPDGLGVLGLAWIGRALARGSARPRRGDLAGALVAAILVGGHLAFRWTTYHDWVPNTFHAKVGGGLAAAARGLRYVGAFCATHPVLVLAALAGLALAWWPPPPRDAGAAGAAWRREGRGLAVVLAGVLAYVVVVGGDFKPTHRFLLPILALIAVAALPALAALARRPRGPLLLALLAAVHLGVSVLPAWPAARADAEQRRVEWEARRAAGRWLAGHLPPDAWIAVHSSGVLPYYAGLPTIDLWGLNDRHIARAPAPEMGRGIPGHEKTDYVYAFGRRPLVVLPERGLVTARPQRLAVPADYPPDFEAGWRPMSVPLGDGRWLNLFWRADALPDDTHMVR